MRKEKEILKQNSLTSEIIIKLGFRIALVGVCVWLAYKIGMSAWSVVGIYILVHSVFKVIRLAINVVFSLLSILFLLAIISLLVTFIF